MTNFERSEFSFSCGALGFVFFSSLNTHLVAGGSRRLLTHLRLAWIFPGKSGFLSPDSVDLYFEMSSVTIRCVNRVFSCVLQDDYGLCEIPH